LSCQNSTPNTFRARRYAISRFITSACDSMAKYSCREKAHRPVAANAAGQVSLLAATTKLSLA
jgi:hypothetical protein